MSGQTGSSSSSASSSSSSASNSASSRAVSPKLNQELLKSNHEQFKFFTEALACTCTLKRDEMLKPGTMQPTAKMDTFVSSCVSAVSAFPPALAGAERLYGPIAPGNFGLQLFKAYMVKLAVTSVTETITTPTSSLGGLGSVSASSSPSLHMVQRYSSANHCFTKVANLSAKPLLLEFVSEGIEAGKSQFCITNAVSAAAAYTLISSVRSLHSLELLPSTESRFTSSHLSGPSNAFLASKGLSLDSLDETEMLQLLLTLSEDITLSDIFAAVSLQPEGAIVISKQLIALKDFGELVKHLRNNALPIHALLARASSLTRTQQLESFFESLTPDEEEEEGAPLPEDEARHAVEEEVEDTSSHASAASARGDIRDGYKLLEHVQKQVLLVINRAFKLSSTTAEEGAIYRHIVPFLNMWRIQQAHLNAVGSAMSPTAIATCQSTKISATSSTAKEDTFKGGAIDAAAKPFDLVTVLEALPGLLSEGHISLHGISQPFIKAEHIFGSALCKSSAKSQGEAPSASASSGRDKKAEQQDLETIKKLTELPQPTTEQAALKYSKTATSGAYSYSQWRVCDGTHTKFKQPGSKFEDHCVCSHHVVDGVVTFTADKPLKDIAGKFGSLSDCISSSKPRRNRRGRGGRGTSSASSSYNSATSGKNTSA